MSYFSYLNVWSKHKLFICFVFNIFCLWKRIVDSPHFGSDSSALLYLKMSLTVNRNEEKFLFMSIFLGEGKSGSV